MLTDLVPGSFRSLTPWRRRDDFSDFQRGMSRLMRDFFEDEPTLLASAESGEAAAFVPRLEFQETDDKITLCAELPGLTDKDVEVSVDKEYLMIRGEKREEKASRAAGRYLSERRYGAFERAVRLPAAIDKDKISAKFDKGILTIEVPKAPEAKLECKKIPIKH